MFLTKIVVNPSSYYAARLLRPYQAHTTMNAIFPDEAAHPRLLFRVENNPFTDQLTVLAQSQYSPSAEWLVQNKGFALSVQSKPYNPTFEAGERLIFRLLASPVRRSNGKQLPYSSTSEEGLSWLADHQKGFKVLTASLTTQNIVVVASAKRPCYSIPAVQYDGFLEVTDTGEMLSAVQRGIGRSRHLGFGMLSLAKC